jgi:hypothetical protein
MHRCVTQPPASSPLSATYSPPGAGTTVYRVAAGIALGTTWQAGVTVNAAHHLGDTTATH